MIMDILEYQPTANCLQDRVILITGASRGIGRAVAMESARLGATVLLLAKSLDRLEKVYDEIMALNLAQPAILNTDLEIAVADDYAKVAEAIEKEYGRLDAILHNAGRVGGLTPLEQTPMENWSHLITLHLHAPFMLTNACLPLLRKSNDASILFTVDETNKAFWGAYGVSKAGQLGLLSILADELDGDKKIRVNGIHPGKVRTDLRTHNYPGVNPVEFTAVEDITSPFIYFLSGSSKGLTNTVYRIAPK